MSPVSSQSEKEKYSKDHRYKVINKKLIDLRKLLVDGKITEDEYFERLGRL